LLFHSPYIDRKGEPDGTLQSLLHLPGRQSKEPYAGRTKGKDFENNHKYFQKYKTAINLTTPIQAEGQR
jgi:hypothetical protein